MLDWIACLLAPRVPSLLDQPTPRLPDPAAEGELGARALRAARAVERVAFQPAGVTDPYRLLLAMGCRDLVRGETDQNPETAGTSPNYAPFPAFEPVTIPLGGDRPALTGRRSTGAPGAPVVIVVHGLFDSHVALYVVELAESLRRMGFHVLALDLRDHGRLRGQPPLPTLGPEEGRDLFLAAATLSRAEGVSVGLLGLSYGAHCVLHAAHAASVAGQAEVLRGGVLGIGGPYDIHEAVLAVDDTSRLRRPAGLLQRLVFAGLLGSMQRHLRLRLREQGLRPPGGNLYESYVRDVLLPGAEGASGLVGTFLASARSCLPELLGNVSVPTLLLHSRDDPLVPVEHLHKALAAARGNAFVTGRELPAGGHVGLGLVDPGGTLALLATFFGTLADG